jgi:hypothetical protein
MGGEVPDAEPVVPRNGGNRGEVPGVGVERVGEERLDVRRRRPAAGVDLAHAGLAVVPAVDHAQVVHARPQIVAAARGEREREIVAQDEAVLGVAADRSGERVGARWMALAIVAPGSRTNSDTATTPLPDRNGGEQPEYQFAIDGQQVNSEQGYGGQPRYSQDSIAEFQFISNRFDATMGRSTAVQVVAITPSCVPGSGVPTPAVDRRCRQAMTS